MKYTFAGIMADRRGFIHRKILGVVSNLGIPFVSGAAGIARGLLNGGGGERVVPGQLPAAPARRNGGAFGGLGPKVQKFAPSGTPLFSSSRGDPQRSGPLGLPGAVPCIFPFVRQADGSCKFDLDPGEGTGLPGGDGGGFPAQDIGLVTPNTVCVETMQCPTFADGKTGILWMNALTGQVFCLPRATNGTGFGLVRKNRPRRKAFVTAAEISALRGQARTKKKAKKFAALTGQVCTTRGATRSRSQH